MRFPVKAGSIWIAYDMSGLSTLWWDVCKVVAPIMLVIAAAGILLMLWVARRVNRPLLGISDVIYRLSRGETQVDVPMRERRDTIGTIAQATETFRTEMLNSETLRRQAESANRVLESSISYASFLQNALLPDAATLARLGDHAVVWWPRDIVGGDIYVARATSDGVLAGVIDCTGHGVPGAFMSIAAYAAFDHAIEHVDTASPARVLSVMDGYLRRLLARETVTGIDDGLEMGLLSWDEASGHGLFAGAGIDLYVVDPVAAAAESGGAGALHRVRGSKAGLGYRRRRGTASFTDQAVALGGGRCLYMFSDGLIDQVGGEDCRPFGRKRLEDVLVRSAAAPVGDQRDHVVRTVSAWQGDEPQRDDVTMLALRPAADAVSTFELTESAGEGGPGNVPAAAGHARR
jgi:HAMP domain-containing protein